MTEEQIGRDWEKDPVHQDDDGTWWFWTETWADRNGPFNSENEARVALKEYVRNFG